MTDREDFEELERLGDELRQQVGGEFRRVAEEDEYAAAKAQMRSRTLEHVAYELLARGDTVAVRIGGDRIQGVALHAKGDVLAIETIQGDRIDVQVGPLIAIHVLARAAGGGRPRDRFGAESFVARLRELELDGVVVSITAPAAGGTVTGTIEAVTGDHVMLTGDDDAPWFIPLPAIAAVSAH